MLPHKTFYMVFITCSLVHCIFFELHVYFNNAEWKIYRKPFCIFSSLKLPYYRWRTVLQTCIMLWRLQNYTDNSAMCKHKSKKEEHFTSCLYNPQIFPLNLYISLILSFCFPLHNGTNMISHTHSFLNYKLFPPAK